MNSWGFALMVGSLLFCLGYGAGVNRSPEDRFTPMSDSTALDRKTGQACTPFRYNFAGIATSLLRPLPWLAAPMGRRETHALT